MEPERETAVKSEYLLAIFVAIALAASAAGAQQKGSSASGAKQDRPAQHQSQRPEKSPGMSEQGAGRQMRDEDIYGYRLMTERERNQFREQMENAASDAERQQLAAQHREEMQSRAKQKGVELEEPEEGSK